MHPPEQLRALADRLTSGYARYSRFYSDAINEAAAILRARLALATSPLPRERVERVLRAVEQAMSACGPAAFVVAGDDRTFERGQRHALAEIRAILEGRA